MKSYLHLSSQVFLVLFLLGIATMNLDRSPPLRWDEGWTMSVASNWIERGHYGRYLAGNPVPGGLEAYFPVTATVALSFRLFGVGVLQARAPGVIFTFLTLGVMYYLARRLYNRSIAFATLLILLFTLWNPDLHPVVLGRQVLGEMPSLFFLLAGYAIFLAAPVRPALSIPIAVFLWGTALITKAQVFPFWIASLLVPLALALFTRCRSIAYLLVVGLLGSLITAGLLTGLVGWLQPYPRSPVPGLYYVTALVGAPKWRVFALLATLLFGVPTVAGLCYSAWSLFKDKKLLTPDQTIIVKLALLVLTVSWLGWYLLLSNGSIRYLFPATLVGSIFVAAMLYNVTSHFSLLSTTNHLAAALKGRLRSKESIGAFVVVLLVTVSVPMTLKMLYQSYVKDTDRSVLEVVHFLNTSTSSNSLIETYDPELFFLLKRLYHYPPDEIHVDLIRRRLFSDIVSINYNPLVADPDYLVVGPKSKNWQLYDPVLSSRAFRLLRTYSRYEVYERVR